MFCSLLFFTSLIQIKALIVLSRLNLTAIQNEFCSWCCFIFLCCLLKLPTVAAVRRVRQLRQSRIGAGCHPGHERLPDWDEAAEGSAEAVQERQQTLLILARGPPPSPALMLALLG